MLVILIYAFVSRSVLPRSSSLVWSTVRDATRLGRRVRLTFGGLCCAAALFVHIGCAGRQPDTTSEIPEAVSYGTAPNFDGEWVGEVGGLPGVLTVGDLGSGRSYASFRGDDRVTEYVLLMERTMVSTIGGSEVAGNRMVFTWQDGQGARGRGWMLINREETALAGAFGLGDDHSGQGDWNFIRVSL